VVIFGVSHDSEQRHLEFRKQHVLPFPLVADESGAVQKAYGVPTRFVVLTGRVTFLVDRDGRIARVWPDVDPGVHADEVLAAAKELGKVQ
jgi:peroxiredoxin Q/BCP